MKKLAVILIVGLVIRLISITWIINTPQNGDLLRYADWGRVAFLKGFDQTYNKSAITFGGDANNQPPGSLYPISLAYNGHLKAANLLHKLHSQSQEKNNLTNLAVLYFFMRLPSLITEIVLVSILFLFIKRQKGSYPGLAASLLYLNPVLIYNSTFWGQMDSLNNLFFISALMLLSSGKIISSSVCLTLSLMTKLSVLPLLPLFVVQFFKSKPRYKQLITSVVLSLGIIYALILPISKQPVIWFIQFIKLASGGELQNITSEAYNLWYAIFSFPLLTKINPLESALFFNISLSTFGYLLYLIFAGPLLYKMLRGKKDSPEKTFLLFAALALISFLFLPKMHERYLYPFFPLLAISLGFSKRWLWYFISISIVHFLNLFISWDPGYVNYIPYSLLESDWFKWGLGVGLVCIFLIFYKDVLSTENKNKIRSQK